jgi:hypothetical protein
VTRELDLAVTAVRQWVEWAEIEAGERPGLTADEREERRHPPLVDEKLFLDPGESRRLSLTLPPGAFRYWGLEEGAWRIEPGATQILVGESSRDIRLNTRVDLDAMDLRAAPVLGDGRNMP